MAAPQDYPCYTENGYYQPTWGCKEKCCIVPAVTPEGEDSPKWSTTLAARMEDKEPMQQPYFGCNTPPKTVLLKDYDPTTGWTPLHAEGWQVANARRWPTLASTATAQACLGIPLTSPSTWIRPLATRSEDLRSNGVSSFIEGTTALHAELCRRTAT